MKTVQNIILLPKIFFDFSCLFLAGGGKWVLGQEQDSVGGSFSEAESFIGRIYRFDVWDSILDQSNITQLAKQCQKNIDGDLLKWQDFLAGISGKIQV